MSTPNLTPDLTPAQQWLADMPSSYRKIAGHLEAIARETDLRHGQFWGMPDDQINALWAMLGRESTEMVFGMHALCAGFLNQVLPVLAANRFGDRTSCRADRPRDYVINAEGNFELVPLPPPPPPPEPGTEPEPIVWPPQPGEEPAAGV